MISSSCTVIKACISWCQATELEIRCSFCTRAIQSCMLRMCCSTKPFVIAAVFSTGFQNILQTEQVLGVCLFASSPLLSSKLSVTTGTSQTILLNSTSYLQLHFSKKQDIMNDLVWAVPQAWHCYLLCIVWWLLSHGSPCTREVRRAAAELETQPGFTWWMMFYASLPLPSSSAVLVLNWSMNLWQMGQCHPSSANEQLYLVGFFY